MRTFISVSTFAFLFSLAACSNQQVYGIGQTWQRNECFKIDDALERSRCLETADTPYYEYKHQTETAK
jgi:hypothetical protein